jgi:hypothetical protein
MSRFMMALMAMLLGSTVAHAANDATWEASNNHHASGVHSCLLGDSNLADYTVKITGNQLEITPNAQWAKYQSFKVDLASLKADGSGVVMTPRSPRSKTWFFEFEAGHGARKIRWGSLGGMCRWVFIPKE